MPRVLACFAAGVLALAGAGSLPARGQCLPLLVLTQDVAEGHPSPDRMRAQLPASEWELHQPTAGGSAYWLYVPAQTADGPAPPKLLTRLELRRTNQDALFDVVYKTTLKPCFQQLRAELRRLHLKAEPVTCQQCEAERFTAPTYVVTLYNQQAGFAAGKAPYPFVLVVHPAGATSATGPATVR